MALVDPSLTMRLAGLLARPVAAVDRRRAALLLGDWLGCALGAGREDWVPKLAAWTDAQAQGPVAVLGRGRRDAASALLFNAALGNVLEMDDVHREAILHPGPVVIPVALAQAQLSGADAQACLDAIVRGYEAVIRVGRAFGRGHYRYWHPTSTAGAFGAAAAAASVLGLDADACADALGNAGSRTGGLWQTRHEPVPTKSLHNALAAQGGWLAAQWAAVGLAGPRRILEGEQGLFAATAPDAEPDAVVADQTGWLIHQTSLKPWPACRHAHPAIDALRDLLAANPGVDVAAIERVEVATYGEALRFCDRPAPTTTLEAKFSLQHALGAILARGTPRLAHYAGEALAAEDIAARRAQVAVVQDEAIDARFPAHYGARVRAWLHDGTQLQAAREDAFGDPEQPMGEADVRTKALALADWGGIAADHAADLVTRALGLADGCDLAGLLSAMAEARCSA